MNIQADESFKKAGAIPFKWEIRPGVPKSQQQPISPSSDPQEEVPKKNHNCSLPRKLRPPPAADPRTRSVPRVRSERHRFNLQNLLTRPAMGVASDDGCFPSPLLRRATKTRPDPDYMSDLETVSRRSVSSRKSISPFRDSLCSSFSSPRRPVSDADWVGFALF